MPSPWLSYRETIVRRRCLAPCAEAVRARSEVVSEKIIINHFAVYRRLVDFCGRRPLEPRGAFLAYQHDFILMHFPRSRFDSSSLILFHIMGNKLLRLAGERCLLDPFSFLCLLKWKQLLNGADILKKRKAWWGTSTLLLVQSQWYFGDSRWGPCL